MAAMLSYKLLTFLIFPLLSNFVEFYSLNLFFFFPDSLIKGDTAASLPIISYALTSYSPYVAELLMESNIELIAKNDLRFIDTVYKVFWVYETIIILVVIEWFF